MGIDSYRLPRIKNSFDGLILMSLRFPVRIYPCAFLLGKSCERCALWQT